MKDLRRLYKYIFQYPGRVTAAILFGIVAAATDLGTLGALKGTLQTLDPASTDAGQAPAWLGPFTHSLGWFFTDFIPNHPLQALAVICVSLVLVAAVRAVAQYINGYCSAYVAAHSGRLLSVDLYRSMIDQPVGFFTEARVSQAVSRFANDVNAITLGLTTLFSTLLTEPLRLLVFLGVCLLLSWKLTLVGLVIVPPLAWLALHFGSRAKRAARTTLTSAARLMGILSETLGGIRVVKAFRGESYEQNRFARESKELARQRTKAAQAEESGKSLVEFVAFVVLAGMLMLVGSQVIQKTLAFRDALLFFAAFFMMMDPLRKLAGANYKVQQMLAATARVFEYLDLAPEPGSGANLLELGPFEREIKLENVSFGYDPAKPPVLDEINLTVRKGEVVAIVGHSGVGKTTLIGLICGFYRPSAGRITFDGVDVAGVSVASVRKHIGLVTQETVLFDDTVACNIAYAQPSIDRLRLERSARVAHAHEFIAQLAQGYQTVVGEGGSMLSGGQRQRLAIARALYSDPEILILDEATSSVDAESEHLIREAMAELMKGRTVLVIAHRLVTVERADKIVVLDRGRIQTTGTHAELVRTSGVYRDLCARQLQTGSE